MKSLSVLIIHGIGINQANFADDLVKEIRTEFNNLVTIDLNEHKNYDEFLLFEPVAWDRLVGKRQKELTEQIRQNMAKFSKPIQGSVWDKIVGIVLRFANQMARADFAAQFIMDIISYGDGPTRQMIFNYIEDHFTQASGRSASTSVIAHSLGTVIAADLIREKRLRVGNLFTMGSPVQLFSLQYGNDQFKSPVACEEGGRWVNILDADDPIAYRLEGISEAYSKAVYLKDYEVDCGIFGQAHVGYWKDKNVHRVIASKLAMDWLLLNEKIPVEKYNHKLMEYDGMLKAKI